MPRKWTVIGLIDVDDRQLPTERVLVSFHTEKTNNLCYHICIFQPPGTRERLHTTSKFRSTCQNVSCFMLITLGRFLDHDSLLTAALLHPLRTGKLLVLPSMYR